MKRRGVQSARIGDCLWVEHLFSRGNQWQWLGCYGTVIGIQKRSYRVVVPYYRMGREDVTVARSQAYEPTFLGPLGIAHHRHSGL